MDAKLNWTVSDDVNGLVTKLCDARRELMALGKEMWDDDTSEHATVYAHKKAIELLRLADGWADATDENEELSYENRRYKQYTASSLVGKVQGFSVHEDEVVAHDTVRVVVQIDVRKKLYASVRLVSG